MIGEPARSGLRDSDSEKQQIYSKISQIYNQNNNNSKSRNTGLKSQEWETAGGVLMEKT